MFDIGFVELLICGVIALLVLGPERLPVAARTAGRWIGGARRMVSQFSTELDRQLKADELRQELRKAGDIGLEDVEKSVRGALDEAKKYENMVLSDGKTSGTRPAPATRRMAGEADQQDQPSPDEPDIPKPSVQAGWVPPEVQYDPHATVQSGSGQVDTDKAGTGQEQPDQEDPLPESASQKHAGSPVPEPSLQPGASEESKNPRHKPDSHS